LPDIEDYFRITEMHGGYMQKWEYKKIPGYLSERQLDQLGDEGWELVAVVAGGLEYKDTIAMHPDLDASSVYVYLKRPKN
jgi:hypothetical protein